MERSEIGGVVPSGTGSSLAATAYSSEDRNTQFKIEVR